MISFAEIRGKVWAWVLQLDRTESAFVPLATDKQLCMVNMEHEKPGCTWDKFILGQLCIYIYIYILDSALHAACSSVRWIF